MSNVNYVLNFVIDIVTLLKSTKQMKLKFNDSRCSTLSSEII